MNLNSSNILLESGTNELEVVEFIVNYKNDNGEDTSQSFGINVAKVREIIRMPKLTHMPNLPAMVYGVFNLRGQIIPALDLSKYLYGDENKNENNKMIIAEFNKIKVGFIVTDVSRIHRISWTQIISPESMHDFDSDKSSIIGFINISGKHVLMLDVEKVVADIDPKSALDASKILHKIEGKPKAITAEDSNTIRKLITEKLKSAGFEIEAFTNGVDAWNRMQEISKAVTAGGKLADYVNLVITDIEMPMMDGYSLTKNIKSDSKLAATPVVIFSSIVSEDILHKGRSVGADFQLSKPQIGELLETVRVLLERGLENG